MRRSRIGIAMMLLIHWLFVGGCASPTHSMQQARGTSAMGQSHAWINPNLVLPTAELMALDSPDSFPTDPRLDSGSWEFGRNDDRLGVYSGPAIDSISLVEIRSYEYLRTINGQPNDNFTNATRTIKRGFVR